MSLCTIPGTWVATWIVRRTDIRIHSLLMEGLVGAGGAVILAEALRS